MFQPAKQMYQFGDFCLHPAEQALTHSGQTVPLPPRVFDTLLILVRSSGRLVTKDDFMNELWPGVFVEESALAQNISQLRKALDDGVPGKELIQTVPKRGYRFTASVRVTETLAEATGVHHSTPQGVGSATIRPAARELAAQPVTAPQSAALGGLAIAAFGLLAVAILAFGIGWALYPVKPKLQRITSITSSGRVEPWGGIHIDGSRVYFTERQGSKWPLMQTSLSGGDALPVATPFPNTRILDLSPDGSSFLIVNFADRAGNMPLWTIPAQGGAPRRVADIAVDDAAWFPDGRRILYSLRGDLFSADSDGGNKRRLFSVDGWAGDFSWNPGGQRFRFTVRGPKDDLSLWEASLEDGKSYPLLPDWPNPHAECCGAWMPDGKDYVFSATRNDRDDVWMLREPAGLFSFRRREAMQLTAGPFSFNLPVPTKDGKKLVVYGIQYQGKTLRFDSHQRAFIPFVTPMALDVAFSRDGQWMTYIGEGGGLWRSRTDGAERMELLSGRVVPERPRWSPDGSRILYVAGMVGAPRQTYIISRDGGSASPVAKDIQSLWGDWMVSGESVLTDSFDTAGNSLGILAVQLSNGQRAEVPDSKGMEMPRVSPDGRFMAAKTQDENTLKLYDFRLHRWTQIASRRFFSTYKWAADSRYLYFQDMYDPGEGVFRWDSANGSIERVFDYSNLITNGNIRCGFEGFAPDGSYLGSILNSASNLEVLDVELR